MTDIKAYFASDNYRLVRSKTLLNLDSDTYDIIYVPRYAFVTDLWLYVSVAMAGGGAGTVTIGFKGNGETADPDGFMDAGTCICTATGYKRAIQDAQPASQGKWFNDAAGCITITIANGTHTTLMTGFVFAQFSVLH